MELYRILLIWWDNILTFTSTDSFKVWTSVVGSGKRSFVFQYFAKNPACIAAP